MRLTYIAMTSVVVLFVGAFLLPITLGLTFTGLSALGLNFLSLYDNTFFPLTTFTINPFVEVLSDSQFFSALLLTLSTGISATVLSLILVYFIGGGWYHLAVRRSEKALPLLLAFPHTSFAIGLLFLISPSGFLFRILALPFGITVPPDLPTYQDPYGISLTLGLVFKETIFLLFVVLSKMSQLDIQGQLKICASLGYTRSATWSKIIWPQIYQGIRFPFFIVLSYSLSPVDMAIILAGKTPPPFALLILNWFNDPDLNFLVKSAAGSMILILVFVILVFIWQRLEKKYFISICEKIWKGRRYSYIPQSIVFARIIFLGIMFTMLLSLSMNFIWSFTRSWSFPDLIPSRFTFTSWVFISNPNTIELLINTVLISGLAVTLSIVLSVTILEIHISKMRNSLFNILKYPQVRILIFLPLLIPSISLFLGVKWFFLFSFADPHYFFYVLIGHFLIVFPYTYITLEANYLSFNQQYFILAQSLSHSNFKAFFRIKLPMLIKPILASITIGLSVSIMDYLATTILSSGRISTITTESVQLSDGGNRRVMGFFAVLQTALLFLVFSPYFKNLFSLKKSAIRRTSTELNKSIS